MEKTSTTLLGGLLVLCGLCALAFTAIMPLLGISLSWLAPWRFWPMIVLAVGSGLFLMALLSVRRPAFGALFIPAVPINVVGAILLFASVFNQWHVWSFAWSLVVLSVAVGFALAMVFSRVIWYGIPAILIGLNGLVLAFCSLTGLWSWWSVLWTVEPLAVGLVLVLVGAKTHSGVTTLLGFAACGFAAFAFALSTGLVLFGDWVFRLSVPAMLILLGVALLGLGLLRRPMHSVAQ